MGDLRAEKAAFRRRVRALRDAIPPEERTRLAEAVEANLFSLPAAQKARTILLFYSFGSEIPTAGIAGRLMEEGRRVLLPFLDQREMSAAEVRPGEELVATAYGPKEPARRIPVDPSEVDLVIAPGIAFDRAGYRIGYGGGHFDRFLSELRPDATRVGIAFHVQVVEAVPHGPGDQPLDYVITDRETIVCRRG